ncbi:sensor histidine kinase [Allokutzneria albata]|nr:histidine kinase [Allokutzneria albata]
MDPRMRWARIATLSSLGTISLTSLVLPGIGLFREPCAVWIVLGALGILAFTVAQAVALYAAVTPRFSEQVRKRAAAGFVATAVLSAFLVAPVGAGGWATWAWLGGSLLGSAPIVLRPVAAAVTAVGTVGAAVWIAWWVGASVTAYLVITVSVGLIVIAMCWLQVWLWDLLVQAEAGREALAGLAAAEERLRFARDVHDLLGHRLSVIALKAELAARLAPADAEAAAAEAEEVRSLAASALTEVREAVHGYRAVNLRDQLAAIERTLRSSGVRCEVAQPDSDLPPEVAAQLLPVLREASTNMLRHSKAGWCRIEVSRQEHEVRMTVTNDGAAGTRPDRHSCGLRGLADRLAESGGTLRTRAEGEQFVLEATVAVR